MAKGKIRDFGKNNKTIGNYKLWKQKIPDIEVTPKEYITCTLFLIFVFFVLPALIQIYIVK